MRDVLTSKMSNVKPWQEIQVGPGLGKGYTSKGSGGFNAGMEARNCQLPKTVDELRVATNPKVTYGGQVLGAFVGKGAASSANAMLQESRAQGKPTQQVFKNRPDTYYVNEAPVYLHWDYILMLNAGTFLLCILMLLIPSFIISKISPVKAIRFE